MKILTAMLLCLVGTAIFAPDILLWMLGAAVILIVTFLIWLNMPVTVKGERMSPWKAARQPSVSGSPLVDSIEVQLFGNPCRGHHEPRPMIDITPPKCGKSQTIDN